MWYVLLLENRSYDSWPFHSSCQVCCATTKSAAPAWVLSFHNIIVSLFFLFFNCSLFPPPMRLSFDKPSYSQSWLQTGQVSSPSGLNKNFLQKLLQLLMLTLLQILQKQTPCRLSFSPASLAAAAPRQILIPWLLLHQWSTKLFL